MLLPCRELATIPSPECRAEYVVQAVVCLQNVAEGELLCGPHSDWLDETGEVQI